ncbi:PTPLA-domain-containing protein [Dothidotthia symphoricarpi CBS 119687]|uniref:Very-long-chain (3R)-3-hydroxyacyl-CoA dehydratase n=1 Tax=Dothidotthia symphoricarpi CBS 119687 TaxID=1392245 RepID=A0A6A6A5H6_9PLEO|nr:PTPLA-domain-containing protein [Dothidotthia symphoricarpi CBS 119687]KAF2126415.1 PTPLA-domain-containing protein [Dothidotthia symphoricarpi CBS 119687]
MPPKPAPTPPPKSKPQPSPVKNAYLLAYNAVSAALWAGVLYKTLSIGGAEVLRAGESNALGLGGSNGLEQVKKGLGSGVVYGSLEEYTRLVQSLAGLEVLHSLFGVVRAPLLTTLMQVASRYLLVWGIAYNFPSTTQYSPAYTGMLTAWSITEVVRYTYFVFGLAGVGVPRVWTWLRYNTFLPLYPLGVASECWLVYSAIPAASKIDEKLGFALWGVLATYVPGFYVLFTHMLKQRRRVQRAGWTV